MIIPKICQRCKYYKKLSPDKCSKYCEKCKTKKKIYVINFKLWDKVLSKGNICLCNLERKCPCEKFLNKGICECQVFKEVK